MAINYTTKEEADERGLWADYKVAGEIKLAGQSGKQYICNHYDGLFICGQSSTLLNLTANSWHWNSGLRMRKLTHCSSIFSIHLPYQDE